MRQGIRRWRLATSLLLTGAALTALSGCSADSEWEATDDFVLVTIGEKSTAGGYSADVAWHGTLIENDGCVGIVEGGETQVAVFYDDAEALQQIDGIARGVRIGVDHDVIKIDENYVYGVTPLIVTDLATLDNGERCATALGATEGIHVWSADPKN